MQRAPIRVSFINFLNSSPLGWGFLKGSLQNRFDVLLDVPSVCARRLRDGEADVGLIPVIEYQRIPGLRVVADISVASSREVKSVLCVAKTPLEKVARVALDASSRTSVALLKILLDRHFGNRKVEYVEAEPDAAKMLSSCDAALIIGNPALQLDSSGLRVYDLAREWHCFSGLPFVFAFWAVRNPVASAVPELAGWLLQSKSEGLSALPRIAAESAASLGLDPEETLQYLSRHLSYDLGDEHILALERFYSLAREMQLIDTHRPLNWLRAPVHP